MGKGKGITETEYHLNHALIFVPFNKKPSGGDSLNRRRNTMNTLFIVVPAGLLYVAVLFVWRFRCMGGKHPNTDLLIRAWNSFSSSDADQMEGSN